MITRRMSWTLVWVSACGLWLSPWLSAAGEGEYEGAKLLKASDFLPQELLQGAKYRFRNQVETDGYLAHFEIDSDFGQFSAVGVSQAKARIAEIHAIDKLVETSKSDLFAEGLEKSVSKPVDAVVNVVNHPVETVKQAPKTVGHLFGKIGSSIERAANRASEQVSGKGKKSAQGGSELGVTMQKVSGFDKAKLQTAQQLGVDPYSDNPRLQAEMDKVTWAFFAGGLPLRIGAAAVSAGATLAATNMAGVPADMYAMTQSEILLRDCQELESWQIKAKDSSKLLANSIWSTTRRHRLIGLLGQMPTVAGRGWVIQSANQCETADQANFLTEATAMLVRQHGTDGGAFTGLRLVGRMPAGVDSQGRIWVPAPVDFVTWTPEVAAFAQRAELKGQVKLLMHTGTHSDAAQSGFAAAGWTMVPQSRL